MPTKTEEITITIEQQTHRLKLTERDCPRCNAHVLKNEKEECYECPNCGYIDCGDD